MSEEKVSIPSGRIQLEGLLSIQEVFSIKGGVILCHPHPLYGGNMDNPVITTAAEIASQEGFSTLRFNFRGAGESGGAYSEGLGEQQDVKAAADFLVSAHQDRSIPLIFIGYSFGAWVGFPMAAEDERFIGLAAVAPPLGIYDFDFLKGCRKKKLFIIGNRDEYCSVSQLEKWYQSLEDPKSLEIIPDADHFFSYHLGFIDEPLRKFLKKIRE